MSRGQQCVSRWLDAGVDVLKDGDDLTESSADCSFALLGLGQKYLVAHAHVLTGELEQQWRQVGLQDGLELALRIGQRDTQLYFGHQVDLARLGGRGSRRGSSHVDQQLGPAWPSSAPAARLSEGEGQGQDV